MNPRNTEVYGNKLEYTSISKHKQQTAMHRMRYKSLNIKRKLEIIDLVEKAEPGKKKKAEPGKKKKEIAAELSIPPSTLCTILKNKSALIASHAFGSTKKMRHRYPSRTDVDAALFQWFTAARAQSFPINGEIMKTKAEELAAELDPKYSGPAHLDGFHDGKKA